MTRKPLSPGRNKWRVSILAAALAAAVALPWWGGSSAQDAKAATTVTPDKHAAAVEQFKKARDLYQQDKYKEAEEANEKALQLDPTLSDAQLLHKILQSKLNEAPAGGAGGKTEGSGKGTPFKLLTPQQISMIRLQEISNNEQTIRGRVPLKTLQAYWNQYVKTQAGADLSTAAYNNFINPLNFGEQVKALKQANQPQFSESVEITSDPADMIPFRNSIHPWILQNCATSACHGGEKGGKFRLYHPPGAANDAAIYTNFYILSTYAPADGGKLLDRDQPQKSDLLQYALPKVIALRPHPGTLDVHKFGDPNNQEFRNIANWIKGLAYPQPQYGIVYEIPVNTPPATTNPESPATHPAPPHGKPAR
ncbi:MAG: tetratricopeptide repeat protein [Phycisphaerae bacterium]